MKYKYKVTVFYTTWCEVEAMAANEDAAADEAYFEAGKKKYEGQLLHNMTADYTEVE